MQRSCKSIDPKYDPAKIAGSLSKLHIAAGTGNFNAVRAAIRAGADLNQAVPGMGTTPLHFAIIQKQFQMVKELIRAGVDVNVKATDQITPLISAVDTGRVEFVRLLLDSGADINVRIVEYDSALHVAAQGGYLEVAEFLIDRGLDVNLRNRYDETALHTAVNLGKNEMVRLLLRKGTDVNARSCSKCEVGDEEIDLGSNITALYVASMLGNLKAVEMLIQAGADVNARTSKQETPLHPVVRKGMFKLLKVLLKAGADVNAQTSLGHTPLYLAVMIDSLEIVTELLRVEGIDLNPITENRKTPLIQAALNGHLEIVKLLIAKGAPINKTVPNHPYGSVAPLDAALMERKEDVAEFLIHNGADIHAKNTLVGMSALANACGVFGFSPKIGKLLIAKGANVNEKCYDGSSLLHFVAQAYEDPVESIKFLVEHGADPDVKNMKQWTAMHYAIDEGNVKIVEYLATKVKEIDPVTYFAQTPLHFAVDRNHHKIAEILLKNGANPNAQDVKKRTPLHIVAAKSKGQLETAKLLLKYKAAVNLKDGLEEYTPLFSATINQDEKLVDLLLENDSDPNAARKGGVMPIHIASNSAANVHIVKALLDNGAYFDVSAAVRPDYSKGTPIQSARKGGKTEIVRLLELVEKLFDAVLKNDMQQMKCCIQAGAIFNARNVSGKTALHFAVINGNIEAVKILLENGADMGLVSSASFTGFRIESSIGCTPLHFAVTNKNVEIVEILLTHAKELSATKYNQVINAKTAEDGATAMHFAARHNCYDIAKLLIKSGAIYNTKNKLDKMPLQLTSDGEVRKLLDSVEKLFLGTKKGSLEEVEEVLKIDESLVNARDSDGDTSLYWAISKGHMDIVNFLLTYSADYCLVSNNGTTPLHIAASRGNVEIVKTLVIRIKTDNVAKVNDFINAQTDIGTTALHVASSVDVVKCLLEAGAMYNILSRENKTPLKSTKNSDIRKLLKTTHELFTNMKKDVSTVLSTLNGLAVEELKAVLNSQNEQGQTLVAVAVKNGHVKIASKLLKKLQKLS